MIIELNNFSSIFELMCGYNFVNSFGNDDVFRFIDITYNITYHIDDKIEKIKKNIKSISDSHKNTNADYIEHLFSFFDLRNRYQTLKRQNEENEARSHTLYLMAGIFSFVVLLYCGLMSDMHLYINLCLSLIVVILASALFIYVPYLKKQRKLVKSGVSLFFLFALLSPQLLSLNEIFTDSKKYYAEIHVLILYAMCLFIVIIPTIIDLINKSIIKKAIFILDIEIENKRIELFEFENSINKGKEDINPFE